MKLIKIQKRNLLIFDFLLLVDNFDKNENGLKAHRKNFDMTDIQKNFLLFWFVYFGCKSKSLF